MPNIARSQKIKRADAADHRQKTWHVVVLSAITFAVILTGFFLTIPYNYRAQNSNRSGLASIWDSVKKLESTIGNGMSQIQTELQNRNADDTEAEKPTARDLEKERRINDLEKKVFDNIERTR